MWVKEIEVALAEGGVDLAVHSLKDVPAELAPGLALVAIPPRADPRDALVSRAGGAWPRCPPARASAPPACGASASCAPLRPDLQVEILRGNVDTRLRKVAEGVVDAAVLACAGLDRLGLRRAHRRALCTEVDVARHRPGRAGAGGARRRRSACGALCRRWRTAGAR